MNLMPEKLPDNPALLKQMLLEALSRQQVTAEAYRTHIVDLKEQIKLLRDRLFGRKSEQTVEPKPRHPLVYRQTHQTRNRFGTFLGPVKTENPTPVQNRPTLGTEPK